MYSNFHQSSYYFSKPGGLTYVSACTEVCEQLLLSRCFNYLTLPTVTEQGAQLSIYECAVIYCPFWLKQGGVALSSIYVYT